MQKTAAEPILRFAHADQQLSRQTSSSEVDYRDDRASRFESEIRRWLGSRFQPRQEEQIGRRPGQESRRKKTASAKKKAAGKKKGKLAGGRK